MSDTQNNPEVAEELPKAKVKRRRWNLPVVWVVPVVAAIVAGYLIYDRVREFGPKITIKFKDGSGLKAGQTPIKYRGVQIGEVTAGELSEDQQHRLGKGGLRHSAASIGPEGGVLLVGRPGVGVSNV